MQDSRSQGLASPQSFCYILGVETLKNTIREEVAETVRTAYREPVIHTLREIERVAFVFIILFYILSIFLRPRNRLRFLVKKSVR